MLGILPFILAFISEHTVSRKGRMDERGAIGATLSVDLKVFLFGSITSISVERLIISGETMGLGNELMMVVCSSLMISLLFLISDAPKSNFFSSTCLMEE